MSRIPAVDPSTAQGPAKDLLAAVRQQLGVVPNLTRVLANSPAALQGYLEFSGALGKGGLRPRLREQIALTVAQANLCDYCLSAHSAIGGKLGLDAGQLADARRATAAAPKDDAALKLARAVVTSRGELTDADLQQARAAGLSDGEVVEIIAHVALNILTNYVNNAARTVVDFPAAAPLDQAAAAR